MNTNVTAEQGTRPGRNIVPAVDILETEAGLRVWAELPGVDEKAIEVELVEDVLSIRGRIATEAYDALRPVYSEYDVGNFEAKFRLSNRIDGSRISASFRLGVLELELPKVEAAKPKRIEISA